MQGESSAPDQKQLVSRLFSLPREKKVAAFHVVEAGDALRKTVWFAFIETLTSELKKLDAQFVIERDEIWKDPQSFEQNNNYFSLYWRHPNWPSDTGICLQIETARPLKNVKLCFGFASTIVKGVRLSDGSRRAVWDAAEPRLLGSRVISKLENRPDWWPVLITPVEPLDKPFTPEGLAAISEADSIEAVAGCLRTIYEATQSLAVELVKSP